MNYSVIFKLVDTSKVAGWVRAAVGAILVWAIAKWPLLGQFVDQQTQTEIAVAASAIVVGIWSHYAKAQDSDYSKPLSLSPPATVNSTNGATK